MSNAIINFFKRFWLRRQKRMGEQYTLPSAAKMPIVPTKFGLVMVGLLGIMFIWSANHQLNLGYLLTFLLATVMMLSAGLTVGHLSGLEICFIGAKAVFVGEQAVFRLRVSDSQSKARAAISISNEWQQQVVSGVDANASETVTLSEPAVMRGWQQMSALELHTTLPLGWFVSWQWFALDAKVLVYPQPKGNLPLPYEAQDGKGGEMALAFGEEEFSHLKPYVFGDSLARVAWKHAGRGELMLKVFQGEGVPKLNLNYSAINGDIETRLSQLTQWLLQAENARIPYTLTLPSQTFALGLGGKHRRRCLEALALFHL